MSDILRRMVDSVQNGDVRISAHGYDELAEDGFLAWEVIEGAGSAVVVEEYPGNAKGSREMVPDTN